MLREDASFERAVSVQDYCKVIQSDVVQLSDNFLEHRFNENYVFPPVTHPYFKCKVTAGEKEKD